MVFEAKELWENEWRWSSFQDMGHDVSWFDHWRNGGLLMRGPWSNFENMNRGVASRFDYQMNKFLSTSDLEGGQLVYGLEDFL